MKQSFHKIYRHSVRLIWWLFNYRRFNKLGAYSYINNPLKIQGARFIDIGVGVTVNYKTWLAAVPNTGIKTPLLKIGDGSTIGNFNHIYATNKIVIGKAVLTADKVYISDNLHNYENPDLPILKQGIKQLNEVIIGDGSWIGENVCIIGALIGKNCVIGANSVVTKNIPDQCVAVGIPVRIIKRYNHGTKIWEKTNPDGSYIK